MDGYKDIKKSIQKISEKEIEKEERRSVPGPRYYELKASQKDTGKKTGNRNRIMISEPQKNVPLQQIAPMHIRLNDYNPIVILKATIQI